MVKLATRVLHNTPNVLAAVKLQPVTVTV